MTELENILTRKALSADFPKVDMDKLFEIFHATPDASLCTAILLGYYEEPDLPDMQESSNGTKCTMTSFDKFRDKVSYSYEVPKRKTSNFLKTIDKDTITLENWDELKFKGETYNLPQEERELYFNHSIDLEEMKTETSYTDKKQWISGDFRK